MKILILLLALWLGSPAQAETHPIQIDNAHAFETAFNSPNGAVFMEITNHSDTDDKILAGDSTACARVELHDHIHEDGVMRMRRIDSIALPAGETVKLHPAGLHIMLMQLEDPLAAGEDINLSLQFENAPPIKLEVPVRARR